MISPGKILWLWLKIDEFLNFMVKVLKKRVNLWVNVVFNFDP